MQERVCSVSSTHIRRLPFFVYLEEIFFELVFERVDVVGGFQVRFNTVPYFGPL